MLSSRVTLLDMFIKMINLISNHEKGPFVNGCDVVTSARPFN